MNELARTRLRHEGVLGDVELVVEAGELGRRTFAVGDDVLVVKNTYERDALNGMRGTVAAVDVDETSVTVVTQAGKSVVLDSRHLVEGRLDYGYAATTHKAQGVTVDVALVLGTKAMRREAGYVGVSRGRAANYLYSLTVESDEDCLPGENVEAVGRSDGGQIVELTATLGRMTAKQLASERPFVREPHAQQAQAIGLEG